MLAYSPLLSSFDDPSIYYNGLQDQDFNTQSQYLPYIDQQYCSFDDQFMIPPPCSPLHLQPITLPSPPCMDAGHTTSTPAISSQYEEFGTEKKTKKQNHNASERNRRMRINELYASLRDLLPTSDQMKKLSIPNTVGRALKYIPDLQNEMQVLIERKEQLLASTTTTAVDFSTGYDNNTSPTTWNSSTSVEATQLGNGEISIQISTLKSSMLVVPVSEVLRDLEEEDGVIVVDVASSESSGRVFYRIHLMVDANKKIKCESLRKKILSSCHKWENLCCYWMN